MSQFKQPRMQNVSISMPVTYSVKSMSRANPKIIFFIALLHLMLFMGLAHHYKERAEAPQEALPMLVRLIDATKAIAIKLPMDRPKAQPKIAKSTPVTTNERSILLANEKHEVSPSIIEPVSEKITSTAIAAVESVKRFDQKSEPEIAIEPPKFEADYLHNPEPEYPSMSRRRGEQGRLTLKVVVNVHGDPESVQLEKSSGFELLDKSAINAVRSWKFVPAKKNSQTVNGTVIVPVRFSLDS